MRDLLPDLSAEDGSSSFQPLQNEGFASLSASQQAHERLDSLSTFSSQVERQESAEDSWSDKLSREAVVLTWGVGGAFVDTITDPLSKAPEIATAGAFGVGLRVLEHAGARGKALAGVIGLGLLAKMGYEELTGTRWSQFGQAMSSAWASPNNLDSAITATKNSVGSFAVDMTVGGLAYKAAGLYGSRVSRPNFMIRDLSSGMSGRPVMAEMAGEMGRGAANEMPAPASTLRYSELSMMGEKCSLALGEPSLGLRPVAKPPQTREFTLLGERCSAILGEPPLVPGAGPAAEVSSRSANPLPRSVEAAPAPNTSLPDAQGTNVMFADALKGELLHGRIEEFGYLSAIREVADAERTPNFHRTAEEYQSIANAVHNLGVQGEGQISVQYEEVARLVEEHAHHQPHSHS